MFEPRRTIIVGAGASLLAAVVWGALAWRSPTLTYHFAPVVVALAGPLVARSAPGALGSGRARLLAAATGSIAIITALLLWAADRMRGPTFWSDDRAVVEALVFALAAAGLAALLVSPAAVPPSRHRSGASTDRHE